MSFDFEQIKKRAASQSSQATMLFATLESTETEEEKIKILGQIARFLQDPDVFKKWISNAQKEESKELRKFYLYYIITSNFKTEFKEEIKSFLKKNLDIEEYFSNSLAFLLQSIKDNDQEINEVYKDLEKVFNKVTKDAAFRLILQLKAKCSVSQDFILENLKETTTDNLYNCLSLLLKADKISNEKKEEFLKTWTDLPQEILLVALLDYDSVFFPEFSNIFLNRLGHRSSDLSYSNILKKSNDYEKDLVPALIEAFSKHEKTEHLNTLRLHMSDEDFVNMCLKVYESTTGEPVKKACLSSLSHFVGLNDKITSLMIDVVKKSQKDEDIIKYSAPLVHLLNKNEYVLDLYISSFERCSQGNTKLEFLRLLSTKNKINDKLSEFYINLLEGGDKNFLPYIVNHISLTLSEQSSKKFLLMTLMSSPSSLLVSLEDKFVQILKKAIKLGDFTDEEKQALFEHIGESEANKLKVLHQSFYSGEQKFSEEKDTKALDLWLENIKDKNLKGVFPLIYSYYSEDPKKVLEIFKYSLLHLESERYQEGVGALILYDYFCESGEIDEEILNYALSKFLEYPIDVSPANKTPLFWNSNEEWMHAHLKEITDKVGKNKNRLDLTSMCFLLTYLCRVHSDKKTITKELALLNETVKEAINPFLVHYNLIDADQSASNGPVEESKGGFLDE